MSREGREPDPLAAHVRTLRGGALVGKLLLLGASFALALTAADAVVGWAHLNFRPLRGRPNDDAVLKRAEYRTRVVTNSLGFRERRLPGPKPAGTMRIVVLGDSFTQGYGVEEDEAYPRQLERFLDEREPARRHEVTNLGVLGACPIDYVVHLRETGLAYAPDLVVVGVMANDVNDVHSLRAYGVRFLPQVLTEVKDALRDERPLWRRLPSGLWPALYDYVSDSLQSSPPPATARVAREAASPAPKGRALPASSWREVLLGVAAHYHREDEVRRTLAELAPDRQTMLVPLLTGPSPYYATRDERPIMTVMAIVQPRLYADMVLLPLEYDAAWREVVQHLRRIDALARTVGARTMLLYIPSAQQVSRHAWRPLRKLGFTPDNRTVTDTTYVDRLRAFGVEADIPVVDLLTPLRARASAERLYYPLDGHWRPDGHRFAASVLADAILER